MDNQNHRGMSWTTRNAVQRMALGSLYLSLLFVLLSVSFVAPLVSAVAERAGYTPEAGLVQPVLSQDEPEPAPREG